MSLKSSSTKKNIFNDSPACMHTWKTIIKYHKPIARTNIIPCKVPLDSVYSKFCSKYDNYYNLEKLLESLQNEHKKVSMIMDINQSDYYYSSSQFKSENRRILFEEKFKKQKRSCSQSKVITSSDLLDTSCELANDIVYVKAPLSTTCLTKNKESTFKELFTVLDEFAQFSDAKSDGSSADDEKMFDSYILVHCFHGLNRTGAVLCNYIKHRLKVSMKDAIKMFEAARLHKLEYKFTLDMLYDL